jgi:hypothetical protein
MQIYGMKYAGIFMNYCTYRNDERGGCCAVLYSTVSIFTRREKGSQEKLQEQFFGWIGPVFFFLKG